MSFLPHITYTRYDPDSFFFKSYLNIWQESSFSKPIFVGGIFCYFSNGKLLKVDNFLKKETSLLSVENSPSVQKILNDFTFLTKKLENIKSTDFCPTIYVTDYKDDKHDPELQQTIFFRLANLPFSFRLTFKKSNEVFFGVEYKNIHLLLDEYVSKNLLSSLIDWIKNKSVYRTKFLFQ